MRWAMSLPSVTTRAAILAEFGPIEEKQSPTRQTPPAFALSETFEYDLDSSGQACAGRGLVTKTTHADGTAVTNTYNKYGDLLTTTDELGQGHTTTNTYDDYGRLLTSTDALNHTVANNYVPTGYSNSYLTTSKLPFATTLPSGKQTKTYYDGNWRKKQVQVAPGTSDEANTYFTYDNVGNLLTSKDPRNNITTTAYDNRDRPTSVTDPLNHTTSCIYDVHGNKLTETHANGELIEYDHYDAMNRLTHKNVHRDANHVDPTSMTYDDAGNLQTNTDENGNPYSYQYDLMNRRTAMIYPNNLREVYAYDGAGNLRAYTNRSGAVQTFSYDNRNRQTQFSWSDGTSPQTTTYDIAS